jgi:hypothetical protein
MSSMLKIALPMLAAASVAYAECSASATKTIQNSGDASAIATCSTFSGSIAVETGAAGPIDINGVKVIDGNLVVKNNTALRHLGADSVTEITGDFTLDDVQVLQEVNFPNLKTVNALRWNALPNLQALGFDQKITKASVIDIQNTQLQSLEGINVATVDEVKIANNRYVQTIAMQLGNVTKSLVLEANNVDVNITFPNLLWAYNMTFRNCSSVLLPSLESLNDSLGLFGNSFEGFAAPNLTKVGGALAIVSNTEMTNISFPQLQSVNANLQIANNTKLSEIDLPQLTTIGGALDANGNFSKIDIPKLNDVKGAFNIQSTGDVQGTCDNFFKPLADKDRIKGDYQCKGQVANPGGAGTTPTVTGGQTKKTGAASALNVQGNALFVGLAAAFFL